MSFRGTPRGRGTGANSGAPGGRGGGGFGSRGGFGGGGKNSRKLTVCGIDKVQDEAVLDRETLDLQILFWRWEHSCTPAKERLSVNPLTPKFHTLTLLYIWRIRCASYNFPSVWNWND